MAVMKMDNKITNNTDNKTRKGFLNTLEAVFAVMFLLTFVFIALPNIDSYVDDSTIIREAVIKGLHNLDQREILREKTYSEPKDLQGIYDALRPLISQRINMTIGVTETESSRGTIDVSTPIEGGQFEVTLTFHADTEKFDSAIITLEFSDNSDSAFYMNDDFIDVRDIEKNDTKIDISGFVVNGSNEFEIRSDTIQTVDYRFQIANITMLDALPQNTTISIASRYISGNGTTIDPEEVRAFFWRRI